MKIALVGNPNSGKTTMFNALTGSDQYVGNWPGVTVEKKEGSFKSDKNIVITDLPGIYSLSPYTPEEVVARDYLAEDKPDAVINLVDATNLERNLYLTTQLTELGIPVIIALNMIDVIEKSGEKIDIKVVEESFGCPVVPVSALKNKGIDELMKKVSELADNATNHFCKSVYPACVENAIANIECIIKTKTNERWYAIKLFEKDLKIFEKLKLSEKEKVFILKIIEQCEQEMNNDSQGIIASGRYDYIQTTVKKCVNKARTVSFSNKVDKILTGKFFAFPAFAVIMLLVYYLSVTVVGGKTAEFISDTVFGQWIYVPLEKFLVTINTASWVNSLILDGIIKGVGSVISFVPQMIVLFLMLGILEDCGYMSRIAFIMDKAFRYFGLSGKSIIPMLIGTGCSVPGIMASRTIENESDRRLTIITTSFIPCGAKMPVIALFASAFFGDAWWVAPLTYFIGVASVLVSCIILKKILLFSDKHTPFVLELPNYHIPSVINVLQVTRERTWSFIKKAGTIIFLASIGVWFLSNYGINGVQVIKTSNMNNSILAQICSIFAPLFAPLGFGNWQSVSATVLGLVAKEEIVATFGVLYGNDISSYFTTYSAFSFLLFNLLCAPCFAAIGAIKKEMENNKWTLFALLYQTVYAYMVSLIYYQFALLLKDGRFTVLVLIFIIFAYLIFRKSIDKKAKMVYHKV